MPGFTSFGSDVASEDGDNTHSEGGASSAAPDKGGEESSEPASPLVTTKVSTKDPASEGIESQIQGGCTEEAGGPTTLRREEAY